MRYWKICALAVGLALAAASATASDLNKPARDFTIVTFDQQKVTAADLKGKVVVLNYWATWCTPCKAEMLVFDTYIRNHPDTDLRIYAVATENSVPSSKLKPLAQVLHFPLAQRLSGRGYGVLDGVPTTYVIDRAGVVRHAKAGAFTAETFDALIAPLLAEPALSAGAQVTASAR